MKKRIKFINKLSLLCIASLLVILFTAALPSTDASAAKSKKKNTEEAVPEVTAEPTPTPKPAPSFAEGTKTIYAGWKSYCSEIYNISETATVKYKSEDKKIAKVDNDGQISGISAGKTVIIADITDEGNTYSIQMNITVKNPYSKITASTEGLTPGKSFRFELTRYGHREPVTWSLDGSQYANIKAASATDCILTAVAPGTVTLTAECNGTVFTMKVKICEGQGDVFFITPNDEPFNSSYTNYGTYNSKTKGYYLLRSYLEHIQNVGAGVLVLRKGNYVVTNTLCIPSNCTIILEDGAKIIKSNDTGTPSLKANGSLFQTVSFKHASQTGIFSGYGGEKNINLLGEGDATIDLDSLNCVGLVVAHIMNLKVSGLRFINMDTNHFIELDAALNVSISGNYFSGYAQTSITRKEAINIDTPDLATGGFSQNWTSYDGTPVQNVYITDNVFYNIECGVGTHKYTEGQLHKNVQILRNTFINMNTYAVRVMNWDKPIIQNNTFMLTEVPEDERIGILVNGTNNPTISNNRFEEYTTPICLYHWQNTGKGEDYAPIYNELSGDDIIGLRSNYIHNCEKNYVEYYTEFDNFDEDNDETFLKCPIFEQFVIK